MDVGSNMKSPFELKNLNDIEFFKISNDLYTKNINRLFPFHNNAEYSLIGINPVEIIPLCNFVYSPRLKKCAKIIAKYLCTRIDIFCPVIVGYKDSIYQLMNPPIAESHNDKLILCDGMHRVFLAKEMRLPKIYILLIENVKTPLPGAISSWDNVQISDKTKLITENIHDFVEDNFTGYTLISNSSKMFVRKNPCDHNKLFLEIISSQA